MVGQPCASSRDELEEGEQGGTGGVFEEDHGLPCALLCLVDDTVASVMTLCPAALRADVGQYGRCVGRHQPDTGGVDLEAVGDAAGAKLVLELAMLRLESGTDVSERSEHRERRGVPCYSWVADSARIRVPAERQSLACTPCRHDSA